jgi:hypothetical protein
MGLIVVLIFYAIALCVVAVIGATVLGIAAHLLTRRSPQHKRAVFLSSAFPFACVAFAGVWFILYAVVNVAVLQRDPGLGDSWETPLPNGYALEMIDTTDQGTVYNPRSQAVKDVISSDQDSVFGVRQLQVSGSRIFGASDSGYFGRIGQQSKFVDSYFELDTAKGTRAEFKSLDDLEKHAANEGVQLRLREFQAVFSDYRTTWFDYTAGIVLLLVPVTGFLLLLRWIWRIRSQTVPG